MEGNYPVEMGLIVPEGVELMTDVSAADWVVQALWPWRRPMPVGCIVPEGFEAYARIQHLPGRRGCIDRIVASAPLRARGVSLDDPVLDRSPGRE